MTATERAEIFSAREYLKKLEELDANQLHNALTGGIMSGIAEKWSAGRERHLSERCAYYFSAEFLVGRAIFNNILCLGKTEEMRAALEKRGIAFDKLEEVEDAALGNGGLGRLAACFLDSGATLGLPLMGYGIRYRYGLFRQEIEEGFQKEYADDWMRFGDPWSVRADGDSVDVCFSDMTVRAVPYDIPVIGYATDNIGTLRLWQAETAEEFDFSSFNNQEYDESVQEKNRAENISRVLYPNDNGEDGKLLRLRQEYFFSSASLKDIIRNYKKRHGGDFSNFSKYNTIQLNDTHPVIAVPELIRLLTEKENIDFDAAFRTAVQTFNFTNHTVMQEALEKWPVVLIEKILPDIALIIKKISERQLDELKKRGINKADIKRMSLLKDGVVHMADLAIYCSRHVNGVAEIHTGILKKNLFREWQAFYPGKIQNKTNGITPRRWICLCNPGLSELITELTGSREWMCNLPLLKRMLPFADDERVIQRFADIKAENKRRLAKYAMERSGITLDPNTIFDVQIKRLHEYKRQFLNILTVLELYFEIKEGGIKDFYPTTFIFGAKAAPGYARAKGVIKLISEVARLIAGDQEVSRYIRVVFIPDYDVSYAEKLVAAADVSEQISTAGTEASGTGNMKMMLNGAVTLGTFDGANVEIVEEAGMSNNYIFGARVEDIEKLGDSYSPAKIYKTDRRVRRVLDALDDGTLDDRESGIFRELKDSILKGASWHAPDEYKLLLDFDDYLKTKIRINSDYRNSGEFYKKCFINTCCAGKFSSDRTVSEYAEDIWHITPI